MGRIDAMHAFARVVETGSFTKAAETLQLSKTSGKNRGQSGVPRY